MLFLLPYVNFLLGNAWLFFFVLAFLLISLLYFSGNLPVRLFKWFFILLGGTLVLRAILRIIFQYFIWKAGPPSSLLLPPHQPISYFFQYSFTHHLANLLLTTIFIFGSLLVLNLFRRFRETEERKLWGRGEEYIFLSGAFLVRWPLVIPYLFLGMVAAAIYFIFSRQLFGDTREFLNIMPIFAALAPLLIFLSGTVMIFLQPLAMPL